jgi:hypothetical protein
MIVAISASLLAIVCAMALFVGMFAAFSAAHQPFSELAAAKPPLQIAIAGEISAPVAEGRTAPFAIRFQVHAPPVPNGPVIVAVPAALDRVATPEPPVATEPVSNPAANAQATSPPGEQSVATLPHDDMQPPSQDAPAATPVQTAPTPEAKASEKSSETAAVTQQDSRANSDPSGPAPANPASAPQELPVAPSTPHHLAPQLKFVSREADNPASVSTSPPPSVSPAVARKVSKRRKLAVHLHQSHHFRRPRVRQIGAAQTQGFAQPNGFGSTVTTYAPGAYAQPSGFGQSSFGAAPAAIRPRPSRARHASKASSGGISSQ